MTPILHGYWRSTASYRVRIALNLKGISFEQRTYDLRTEEHKAGAFRERNPQGLVPALEVSEGVLIQSSAILEWLEETYPDVPLLPRNRADRALVRSMAAIIACDVHPLNNLRVLSALRGHVQLDEAAVSAWISRWILEGFEALEILINRFGEGFAFGATPTLADCYLVPQMYSAARFSVDTSNYPRLVKAVAAAQNLAPFIFAHPDKQSDAVLE